MRHLPAAGLMLWFVVTIALEAGSARAIGGRPRIAERRELARVRAHILGAEHLANQSDLSSLTPAARASRERLLGVLSDYRVRGRFPRNRDFHGHRVPYFIDRDGTRCAMAFLIESTGDSGLVARVARTCNNAHVRDLARDPELVAWLERNGLTIDEAARIQPSYDFDQERNPAALEPAAIAGVMTAATAGFVLNLDPPKSDAARRWRGGYAVAAGFVGVVSGVSLMEDPGDLSPGWGASCLTLGAVCLLQEVHRLASPSLGPQRARVDAMLMNRKGTPQMAVRLRF